MADIDLTVKLPSRVEKKSKKEKKKAKERKGMGKLPSVGSGKRSNRVPGQRASPGLLSRATGSPQNAFPTVDV